MLLEASERYFRLRRGAKTAHSSELWKAFATRHELERPERSPKGIFVIASRQVLAGLMFLLLTGCGVYSFNGGAIPPGAKTMSIDLFDARAPLCSPQSAQVLTETVRDVMQAQTPLKLQQRDGDIQYEGFVSDYRVEPVSIQANESAALNRLTIAISVHYTNTLAPKESADITASRFADYSSSQDLATVEENLVREISKQLAQDVFDKTLGNW
jgi:hypothetical protein